ncbi:response regulator [Halovenus sp. WSH3]|uniref:Response regulator n=1 Tax=Halovenus carboxidivorans TaxID=2692199 RepID=A0A6B0T1P5_9EURY|nr:response regulator [Halovenus carboxidivorans]MXR51974.1 response regulator [Halovenus carboxidivorans]
MAAEIDVLVVDEDDDMLELTETFLERESDAISVTTEKHPPTAAERLEDGEFDCVVSDLRMPEMDGIELCQAVREKRPELPFFLFTAASPSDIESQEGSDQLSGTVQKGTGTDHYTDLANRIEAASE